MSSVKKAATLGITAVATQFLGALPPLAEIAGIASLALLIFAHREFSKAYGDRSILGYTLIYAGVTTLGALAFAIGIAPILGELTKGFALKGTISIDPFNKRILVAGGALYISLIVGFYYLAKGLHLLAYYTGTTGYILAGNLMFYGAIGTIAFGAGFVVILFGWIVCAFSYYSTLKAEG